MGRGDDGSDGDDGGDGDSGVPTAAFPCYRWLESGELQLREGTARTPRADEAEPLLLLHRNEERREREENFRWAPYSPGWPWRLRAVSPSLSPWPTAPDGPELPRSAAFPARHRLSIAARVAAACCSPTSGSRSTSTSWPGKHC